MRVACVGNMNHISFSFAMPPLLNVVSSEQLAGRLGELVESSSTGADIGRRSSEWMRDCYGWSAVDHYISAMGQPV